MQDKPVPKILVIYVGCLNTEFIFQLGSSEESDHSITDKLYLTSSSEDDYSSESAEDCTEIIEDRHEIVPVS